MATRSAIVVKMQDGTFRGVYCHSDGYPSHMGKMLQVHYNTSELATALVNLGHLSQVNRYIATFAPHSFDAPQRDVVVAFGRDRGEEVEFIDGPTLASVLRRIDYSYNYLYADGEWTVARGPRGKRDPVLDYRREDGEWFDLTVRDSRP